MLFEGLSLSSLSNCHLLPLAVTVDLPMTACLCETFSLGLPFIRGFKLQQSTLLQQSTKAAGWDCTTFCSILGASMVRTFSNAWLGPLDEDLGRKTAFVGVWVRTAGQNRRQILKTRRWGKWPILDLFRVHGCAISCQKRETKFWYFPNVSWVFFHYHHYVVTRIWACFTFHIYCHFLSFAYYKYSTTQHTTYTIHNHTHAHTHAHLPLTVILRVVCVRVTLGKTREICLKKAKSGGISCEGSFRDRSCNFFVCGEVAKDQSNSSEEWSLPEGSLIFNAKRMLRGLGHALFSTLSQTSNA